MPLNDTEATGTEPSKTIAEKIALLDSSQTSKS